MSSSIFDFPTGASNWCLHRRLWQKAINDTERNQTKRQRPLTSPCGGKRGSRRRKRREERERVSMQHFLMIYFFNIHKTNRSLVKVLSRLGKIKLGLLSGVCMCHSHGNRSGCLSSWQVGTFIKVNVSSRWLQSPRGRNKESVSDGLGWGRAVHRRASAQRADISELIMTLNINHALQNDALKILFPGMPQISLL